MKLPFGRRPDFNTILRACVLAVAAAAAFGAFGKYDWRLDLFSHWRLQYVVAGALLLPLLLIRRQFRYATLAVVIVLLNATNLGYARLAMAAGSEQDLHGGRRHLRVAHFNVLFSNPSYAATLDWLRREKPDLVSLVEDDPAWDAAMRPLRADLPYVMEAPGEGGSGMTLYSRFPLIEPVRHDLGELVKPAITAAIEIDGERLTVVAAHPWPPTSSAKAREHDRYLAYIASFIRRANGPVLLAGDLNTTPWSHIYREFLEAAGLSGPRPAPTWPAELGFLGIPLDHILGRGVRIDSVTVGPRLGSDHRPLSARISF